MNNENYVNYYVEILTNTLTDAVVRNVSLQANAKISDDVINHQNKQIDDLKNKLKEKEIEVENCKNHIERLEYDRENFESVKSQVTHLDTFRSELMKSRKENEELISKHKKVVEELNSKIEFLQLSPAQRKKVTPVNTTQSTVPAIKVKTNLETITKDGGSF
jgi:predicted nuclease with TOPRIM domain